MPPAGGQGERVQSGGRFPRPNQSLSSKFGGMVYIQWLAIGIEMSTNERNVCS